MQHAIIIFFLFAFGACIGSFINVVVWRLPRNESLWWPPSRCPRCGTRLAWYDNFPVFGWLILGGECRYCKGPISPRYPIVEFVMGATFVLYYVMFFMVQKGPCAPVLPGREMTFQQDYLIYMLYMMLLAILLAASLIDAENFFIPIELPWLAAAAGVLVHTFVDAPRVPGALMAPPPAGAMAAGGAVGLLISIILLKKGIIPMSFSEGAPLLEHEREMLAKQSSRGSGVVSEGFKGQSQSEHPSTVELQANPPREYTRSEIRAEMRKEMLFLLPPMLMAILVVWLCTAVGPVARWWNSIASYWWLSGMLGSILGALVGGLVVWAVRIIGTIAFGREAMGMGDVHLMFGVGAIIGAGASTVAFFIAPFFGILTAFYMLLTGKRRELPYGPYLSMATAFVMIWYCDIANYLRPGMLGLSAMLRNMFGSGVVQ